MLNTSREITYEEVELAAKEADEAVQTTLLTSYDGEWMPGVTRILTAYAVKDGEDDPATKLEFATPIMKRLTEIVAGFFRCSDYQGPANFGMLRRTHRLLELSR